MALATGNRPSATGNRQPATGNRQPATEETDPHFYCPIKQDHTGLHLKYKRYSSAYGC